MSKNATLWEHVETNLIRYKPNGKYYAKLKIHGKKVRECLETDKLAEARRKLSAMLARVRGGVVTKGRTGLLMQALIEEWKTWLKTKIQAKRTTKCRLDNLDTIKKTWSRFETVRVSSLTRYDVESWRDGMVTTHKYSHSQANQCLGTLRQILRLAEDKGLLLNGSPAARVKQLRPNSKRIILPTKEMFNALKLRIYSNSQQGGKLFEFLALTGARINTAQNVKWGHVDWEKNELHFLVAKRGGYSIPLFAPLKEFLTKIRPPHFQPGDNIFHIQSIKKTMGTSCKRLGIFPRLSHHSLRHWFATHCIEKGVDIPTLSRWLGHKDGGALALRTYGHLRQEHSQSEALKIT